MNIAQTIDKASSFATLFAPSMVARLASLQKQTENRMMKVVVLGDFKAGKSTIINRLFLRKPILPRRHAECTAVPTYITNGAPRLQLWKREKDGSETLVRDIPDITAEELESCITAGNDKKRGEMAKLYSKAVLTMPDILPDGICLVDTPGLNSTNPDIITGTELEAHNADAILYVRNRTELASREEHMIRMLSGSQTPKVPFFVVLTHDGTQAASQAEEICRSIKASLAMSHVDVQCAPFNYDEESTMLAGQLKHFFESSVQQGRMARIQRELLPMLDELKGTIAGKISLCDASDQKIAALTKNIAERKADYQVEVEAILADIRSEQFVFKKKATEAIAAISSQKISVLESKTNLSDVQQEISKWSTVIPEEISDSINVLRIDYERNIRSIANVHCSRLQHRYTSQSDPSFNFEPGFLTSIPSWLITVADYAIFTTICPFWLVVDIPLRFVLQKLPIFPANIAVRIMKSSAISSLETAMEEAKLEVEQSMDQTFRSMNDELRSKLQQNGGFIEMERALEEARTAAYAGIPRASLEQAIVEIDALIACAANN